MKHSIWLVAVGSMAAVAHGADEATQPRTIEEIVITATYRDTKLMDTPQSISALSGDAIKDLGAKDITEIFQQIPALNVAT
jgi:iron complex outermembrane receptor protein